jgi:hypothetical protein
VAPEEKEVSKLVYYVKNEVENSKNYSNCKVLNVLALIIFAPTLNNKNLVTFCCQIWHFCNEPLQPQTRVIKLTFSVTKLANFAHCFENILPLKLN